MMVNLYRYDADNNVNAWSHTCAHDNQWARIRSWAQSPVMHAYLTRSRAGRNGPFSRANYEVRSRISYWSLDEGRLRHG